MFTSRKIDGSQGRRRNQAHDKKSLGFNTKYKTSSVNAAYDMAVDEGVDMPINASLDRAAKANSHLPIVDGSDSDRSDSDSDSDEYKPSISDSLRRHAILYHYLHVLECPDRDEWYGSDGTIIRILLALKMNQNQHQTVKIVHAR